MANVLIFHILETRTVILYALGAMLMSLQLQYMLAKEIGERFNLILYTSDCYTCGLALSAERSLDLFLFNTLVLQIWEECQQIGS